MEDPRQPTAKATRGELVALVDALRRRVSDLESSLRDGVLAEGHDDITERKRNGRALLDSEARFRALFEGAADGILVADIESGAFVLANPAMCDMVGYTAEELLSMQISDLHPKEDLGRILADFMAVAPGEKSLILAVPCLRKDGSTVYADISGAQLVIDGRNCNAGFFVDVTERKEAEAARGAAQRRYQELFDNVGVGLCRTMPEPQGTFLTVNPAMVAMFEADSAEQLLGLHPSEIFLDESQRRIVSDAIARKGFFDGEVRCKTRKGGPIWCRMTARKATDASGQVVFDNTVENITSQKEAQNALEASENKYRRLFEELQDAIFVMSTAGLVQDMNRAGRELFQIPSLDEVPSFNLLTDLSLVNSEWVSFIDALEHDGRALNHEISFRRSGGEVAVVSINANMVWGGRNGDGVIRGIARDLTRRRQLERRAITDELTTLNNRAFFDACLASKVKHARSDRRTPLSLLFLDIDDFKAYNDAYGHQEGDYVVHKIAQAILSALRVGDVAARYGGEEFTVIVPCGPQLAAQVAERVRVTVEELCSVDRDERIKRSVTASIGVASLGVDAKTAQKLVNVADARMYEAKRLGKNRVSVSQGSASQRPTHRA